MSKKMDGQSLDIEQIEREKLRAVFPECFVEDRLDIDKLLSMCGEYITDDFERYEFKWKGKSECLQLAQKRSTGTLRPCRAESVNFDDTQNLYIEGDNLEVLKLLQTAYYRQVKMIYIDPPYNTGNDFVYEDDFRDPMARYKEVTRQTTKSNPESMGRFHTNWLNMMYPRLRLAANLLRDDGVCFISIDDNEVHNLRKLCDEVFGEENFVAQMLWQRRQRADNRNQNNVSSDHEYILCYSKISIAKFAGVSIDAGKYKNPDNDTRGPWASIDLSGLATAAKRPNLHYDIIDPETGISYPPNPNRGWSKSKARVSKMIEEGRILFPKDRGGRPREKKFLNDLLSQTTGFSTCLNSSEVGYTTNGTREISELFDGKYFDFPKPTKLVRKFIQQVTNDNDIILDFFSGSATTAHAVMQLNAEDGGNRRFIMVQLPEVCDEKSEAYKAGYQNICEIGKERIRRAGAKLLESDGQMTLGEDRPPLDVGFKVFKLDTSNLKTWDSTPVSDDNLIELLERMNGMIDRIKHDRTDMDVVYEVMLKLGVPLTESVSPMDIGGKTVYSIREDALLLVCLQTGVTTEIIEMMADYAPAQIILAEGSMADDTAMANAHYVLENRGIDLKLV